MYPEMKGSLLLFLTFVGILLGLSYGQICPPPEVLAPCTCTEELRTEINCSDIQDPNFRLKPVLDRASEFIGGDVVFDYLAIKYNANANMEIEEGAVEHLKFKGIEIHFNPNLKWISPRAFGATRNVTTYLSLAGNNFHNREGDVFELVNSFENLIRVELIDTRLSSIPSNAFRNQVHLDDISLAGNQISSIGSRIFFGAPNLTYVILNSNSIPSEGLPVDAFDGISTSATVNLLYNGQNFLEQKSYESLLDQALWIEVGDRTCDPTCHRTRDFYCDERANWICEKEDVYRPKLWGFACKVETGFENVWEYCGNRTLLH